MRAVQNTVSTNPQFSSPNEGNYNQVSVYSSIRETDNTLRVIVINRSANSGIQISLGCTGRTVAAAPATVIVAPHAVHVGETYSNGVTTVQGGVGGKAVYNPHTGNAAVSTRNANGVATTKTLRGGEAKTKNGMGVVQGAGGKTCVKGHGAAKCN